MLETNKRHSVVAIAAITFTRISVLREWVRIGRRADRRPAPTTAARERSFDRDEEFLGIKGVGLIEIEIAHGFFDGLALRFLQSLFKFAGEDIILDFF